MIFLAGSQYTATVKDTLSTVLFGDDLDGLLCELENKCRCSASAIAYTSNSDFATLLPENLFEEKHDYLGLFISTTMTNGDN
jgi:hypothetical protein